MKHLTCRKTHHLLLLVGLSGTLAACGFDRTLADRTTLGANQSLTLFSDNDPPEAQPAASTPTTTLSRSNWHPTDYIVPVDGTVHGPLWRWNARSPRQSPRQKALYPTLDTAFDMADNPWPQIHEAVKAPFIGLANVLALPVIAAMDLPGNHMSPSPRELYKRNPPASRPMAGPIPTGP